MASASRGKVEIVDLCLMLGADASYKLNNGWTAIDCARLQGQQEAEKMLLEYQQLQVRLFYDFMNFMIMISGLEKNNYT